MYTIIRLPEFDAWFACANFGPGWRMYDLKHESMLIVMLGGGDKTTQPRDITRALYLASEIEV